jgi:hypothetical protein
MNNLQQSNELARWLGSTALSQAIESEKTRRHYLADPVAWVTEKLGEQLWSQQRTILEAVRDNRRVAVPTCFGCGKSWTAARLAGWWLDTHPPGKAFVVTTATTGSQVQAVLWREISRAHAHGHLPGRLNQTEWYLTMSDGREELVAFGRKPADFDPVAFQGIHARFVLVIVDEASGVPEPLCRAADGLIVNAESRLLLIGNPDDQSSYFASVSAPGSPWKVIQISAFDTPNFTGEPIAPEIAAELISVSWAEDLKREVGESSPYYISRVLGLFPESREDALIPWAWIQAAQMRTLEASEPNEIGMDVGAGGDKTIIAHRRGSVVRIIRETTNPDTMVSTGQLIDHLRQTGAAVAKVDKIGVGQGVVDRALEQGQPVIGVQVGLPSLNPERYLNLRAQYYWGLRQRFESGDIDIDPTDRVLAAQLAALRHKPTSRGQVQIESKDDMRRRGLPSPDRADAVMLAFADARPFTQTISMPASIESPSRWSIGGQGGVRNPALGPEW